MAGSDTLEFTDGNFEDEVLNADTPVLVDFWAQWCSPCRALAPTIDDLATSFADKIKVGKLDIDQNNKTAARFTVSSIPTVILFHNGEIVEKFIGLKSKADYEQVINGVLTTS